MNTKQNPMKKFRVALLFTVVAWTVTSAVAQPPSLKSREREFMEEAPVVGDPLPSVEIFDVNGKRFSTDEIRGHYTVLTFGCLTCPPSIWNIQGMEAVKADYAPKGVKFYFVFKSLAHPELVGDYVQPYTDAERLMQAQHAVSRFGTTIPWLVDRIDNRFKHAMGNRPNSQFIVDPSGTIVRKRAWANYKLVREDLEELVGRSSTETSPSDIELNVIDEIEDSVADASGQRIKRVGMRPLVIDPQESKSIYYAKLRAEAGRGLFTQGRGKLYIGFHLDPLYDVSWNNLSPPLRVALSGSSKVELEERVLVAERGNGNSDSRPREFLLNVESWPDDQSVTIDVSYAVCEQERECVNVAQSYVIYLKRDRDGGGARSAGGGLWQRGELTERLLASDSNKDGQIEREEAAGLLLPHFERLDRDGDGGLDRGELGMFTEWVNHRHRPSGPQD
jgi:hypothetical protein